MNHGRKLRAILLNCMFCLNMNQYLIYSITDFTQEVISIYSSSKEILISMCSKEFIITCSFYNFYIDIDTNYLSTPQIKHILPNEYVAIRVSTFGDCTSALTPLTLFKVFIIFWIRLQSRFLPIDVGSLFFIGKTRFLEIAKSLKKVG